MIAVTSENFLHADIRDYFTLAEIYALPLEARHEHDFLARSSYVPVEVLRERLDLFPPDTFLRKMRGIRAERQVYPGVVIPLDFFLRGLAVLPAFRAEHQTHDIVEIHKLSAF